MSEGIRGTFVEVAWSISPIVAVALAIQVLLLQTPWSNVLGFVASVGMVLLGFTFFLVGVKEGMLPIGEAVGSALPSRGSVMVVVAVVFTLSFLVTIAEPDVRVLSSLISSVSGNTLSRDTLLLVISLSLAIMMALGSLRVLFRMPIKYVFAIGYSAVIVLSFFVPERFFAISFDSGGVTTGPMTVPVILALGVGLSSVLGKKGELSETFGLIGIASIGPILGLMLMGVLSP